MSYCEKDEDPFSEELLLNAICALRNVTTPPKRKYKKRKKAEKPKVHVDLDPRFLVSPPEHYKPLPQGDNRWKVPEIINNVYCSGDPQSHKQILFDLFDPQLEFFMQYDGKQNPYGPNTRYIKGLREFLSLAVAFLFSAPDIVNVVYEPPAVFYDEETDSSFGCFKCLTSLTKTSVVMNPEQFSSSSASGAVSEVDIVKTVNDYNLVRLPASQPVVPSYQVTRYTYAMNPQHKITIMCLLFKHIFKESLTPESNTAAPKSKDSKKAKQNDANKKRKTIGK